MFVVNTTFQFEHSAEMFPTTFDIRKRKTKVILRILVVKKLVRSFKDRDISDLYIVSILFFSMENEREMRFSQR